MPTAKKPDTNRRFFKKIADKKTPSRRSAPVSSTKPSRSRLGRPPKPLFSQPLPDQLPQEKAPSSFAKSALDWSIPDPQPEPELQPPTLPPDSLPDSDQISQLKDLIEQTSLKLQQLEVNQTQAPVNQPAPVQTDPEEFNGVSSEPEEHELIHESIQSLKRQNQKLKAQLELVQEEFEKEKKSLEKTIQKLKTDLHRTTPIQDNKFFSLSKELSEAVQAIKELSPQAELPLTTPNNSPLLTQETPQPASPQVIKADSPPAETTPPKKKVTKEKKLLITGGSLLALLSFGGFLSYKLTSTPSVDPKLVNDYINQGQVQGIQSSASPSAPTNKQADKNAQQPFDQTKWETFKDSLLGVQLQYPVELTERLHSQQGITFLRSDGYLFKLQLFPTDLELEEFWEKQKDTGLAYEAEATQFKNLPALKLTLSDSAEYPGDRYLVKTSDGIFDIWYATQSDKFSHDDFQRVDYMLQSIAFLN